MKTYIVEFVVQAEDLEGAQAQAELLLNAGTRVVDFNIRQALPMEAESNVCRGRLLPVPADRI